MMPPVHSDPVPQSESIADAGAVRPSTSYTKPTVKKARTASTSRPQPATFNVHQDTGTKPNYSYAQLIAMAILSSPDRKLALNAIYRWIADHFSYYKMGETGWQNSIRHNLSLQKSFKRIDRAKEDPGKGSYWAIEDGHESSFLKEKPPRKSAASAENLPVMSTRLEPSKPIGQQDFLAQSALPPLPVSQQPIQFYHLAQPVSSDATIVLSDPVEEPPSEPITATSPIRNALSPVKRSSINLLGTTPRRRTLDSSSSVNMGVKRKAVDMEDSGYISSLDSSASRAMPKKTPKTKLSRERKESGRAEDAIARITRIRSSPYSPTRSRSQHRAPMPSSPPLPRTKSDALKMVTPNVKLIRPPPPPPSISPTTNLTRHRHAVSDILGQSFPITAARLFGEMSSPVPGHEGGFFDAAIDGTTFNIWTDSSPAKPGLLDPVELGSPIKRSAKRLRTIAQATSTPSKLSVMSAPKLKAPETNIVFETPSKALEGVFPETSFDENFELWDSAVQISPSKVLDDSFDLWTGVAANNETTFLGSSDSVEEEGIDICQGFPGIGSTVAQSKSKSPLRDRTTNPLLLR